MFATKVTEKAAAQFAKSQLPKIVLFGLVSTAAIGVWLWKELPTLPWFIATVASGAGFGIGGALGYKKLTKQYPHTIYTVSDDKISMHTNRGENLSIGYDGIVDILKKKKHISVKTGNYELKIPHFVEDFDQLFEELEARLRKFNAKTKQK